MNKKIKILFIFLAFIFAIFCFNNKSYCADEAQFKNWVEENKNTFESLFYGYNYVIVNNFYKDYVICYYSNAPGNMFYFTDVGSADCYINNKSDLGDNYFHYCIFNRDGINTFSFPSSVINTTSVFSNDNNHVTAGYDSGFDNVLYSTYDVTISGSSKICAANPIFEPFVIPAISTLEWSFDRQVNTIVMSSQHFSFDEISKYNLYYTTDNSKVSDYKNLDTVPIGSFNDTTTSTTSYFYFLSFDNYYTNSITYYFILEDKESGEILASSMTVDFDSLNEHFDEQLNEELKNSGIYGETFSNSIPNLKMTYKRYTNADNTYYYQISSQYFSQYEVTDQYIAYYTNNTTILEDYSLWDTLNIATFNNTKTGQTDYYYFFNTPTDSENSTYYFVLYNKITGQYGAISSLTLDYAAMWEYSEQLSNDNGQVTTRFDNLINYLKDRFGFLTYPFELIGEIFNRFYTIDWQEPIIKIPALSVPIYGQKLTDEITYNFNDLLSIPVVKYIHDIYLIIADVILIYAVIQFGMKVFGEVFGND